MDVYLTLVSKEFVKFFSTPTQRLQIAAAVNAVLAGNEGGCFAIKWRMWLFHFFERATLFRVFPVTARSEKGRVVQAVGAIS